MKKTVPTKDPVIIAEVKRTNALFHKLMKEAKPDLQVALAKEYGVNQSVICRAVRGQGGGRSLDPELIPEITRRYKKGRDKQQEAMQYSRRATILRLEITPGIYDLILSDRSKPVGKKGLRIPDNLVTRFLTRPLGAHNEEHDAICT